MEAAVQVTLGVPVGQIRRFGAVGPAYEVGRPVRQLADGDWMVEIVLVETGERTEYRRSHMMDDPAAV